MSAKAYYSEWDPYCAQWLRNLIAAGHIAPGEVDERSITEVQPDDLKGFTQCHFFAGIGGWSFALRKAGWADDRPVWTGSCPCQPFSVAGKQAGFDDDRHLWPQFRRVISERRPTVVFGEQVANASDWVRLVRSDLEEMDYAVGCLPVEAASASSDHFRDRYWFVADADFQCASEAGLQRSGQQCGAGSAAEDHHCAVADRDDPIGRAGQPSRNIAIGYPAERDQGNSDSAERRDSSLVDFESIGWGEGWTESEFRSRGFTAAVASIDGRQYVECPDGKWRRLPPPGVRWLGTRIPARVAKLRAFGNAIDWRPAAQFIGAYLDRESVAA